MPLSSRRHTSTRPRRKSRSSRTSRNGRRYRGKVTTHTSRKGRRYRGETIQRLIDKRQFVNTLNGKLKDTDDHVAAAVNAIKTNEYIFECTIDTEISYQRHTFNMSIAGWAHILGQKGKLYITNANGIIKQLQYDPTKQFHLLASTQNFWTIGTQCCTFTFTDRNDTPFFTFQEQITVYPSNSKKEQTKTINVQLKESGSTNEEWQAALAASAIVQISKEN